MGAFFDGVRSTYMKYANWRRTAAKRMMYLANRVCHLANRVINLQIEKGNLQIVSSVLQIERQSAY